MGEGGQKNRSEIKRKKKGIRGRRRERKEKIKT